MPKYLCMQRSLASDTNASGGDERPSPAEMQAKMQAMYAKFGAWKEKFEANLVDMGGKLGEGTLVTKATPKDGPFVEVKELVGGYMIVEAENIEAAIEVASGCPGLVTERSGVEVIEIRTP